MTVLEPPLSSVKPQAPPVFYVDAPLGARVLAIMTGIAALSWPALLNGYPLVFADTGTYLSQAIQHYLGWDRPAFYSLFLFAIHWRVTTWPIAFVQAALTLYFLDLTRRAFAPETPAVMMVPLVAVLATVTPVAWFSSQIMPDIFTGLLALALAALTMPPASMSRLERGGLCLLTAWMIAFHLSHIWISVALIGALLPARWLIFGAPRWRDAGRVAGPLLLALAMLCTANLAAFHRFSVSPFGKVFLFTRIVYDGPGLATLDSDCASRHWAVCRFRGEMGPDKLYPTSDHFLWLDEGPLTQLGGAKRFAGEAGQVAQLAIEEHPLWLAETSLRNWGRQFVMFRSGDGLRPWPIEVGRWIARDFPAREYRAFLASEQNRDGLTVPGWIDTLYAAGFWIGLGLTAAMFVWAVRERHPLALLCGALLLTLLVNAAVTGALSGPHNRYQDRVIWLALVAPLLVASRQCLRVGDRLLLS